MSDLTGYILVLGVLLAAGYAIIPLAVAILRLVYQNQSILLAFPFL